MGLVFWVPIATEFKNIFEIHHIFIKEFFYFKHFLKQFAKQYIFFFSYTTHWFSYTTHWFSYTTHWFSYTTHWFSYTTQWFSYRSYFSIVSIIVFDISLNIVSMCYIFLKTSNTHLFSKIFDIFFFLQVGRPFLVSHFPQDLPWFQCQLCFAAACADLIDPCP